VGIGTFGRRLATLAAGTATLCLFAFALGAHAANSVTVTRTDDPAGSGNCPTDCSLRQAVAYIEGLGGGTVDLPPGSYTLTQNTGGNALFIGDASGDAVTIASTGTDARTTVISQTNGNDRVIQIGSPSGTVPGTSAHVTITGVTIKGGATNNDPIEDNAGVGGGVWVESDSTLTLEQSEVTGNTATNSGGGIDSNGTLTIDQSLIDGNTVRGGTNQIGGGIDEFGTGLTITNSTIVNNTSAGPGGGLLAGGSTDALLNDTFNGNTSSSTGLGNDLAVNEGVVLSIEDSSFSSNGNTNPECSGPFTDNGWNSSFDSTCQNSATGDITDTDPNLGPLQDNGGGTNTEAPQSGSPLLGAASGSCPAVDQRNVSRTFPCAIGAVEEPGPPLVTDQPNSTISFDTTATVEADIDPNSADDTTFVVDYGTTANYGQTSSSGDAGSDGLVTKDVTLTGLQPNTTYHWRFEATNANGTTDGADETFTTGPQVTGTVGSPVSGLIARGQGCPDTQGNLVTVDWGDNTAPEMVPATCSFASELVTFTVTASHTYATAGHFDITTTIDPEDQVGGGAQISPAGGGGGGSAPPATPPVVTNPAAQVITGTSATVSASVNPNGLPTTYVVEYGPSASYGDSTTAASAGSATTPQTVTATLTGLSASSTYHYRFVATSSAGTTNGSDQALITTTGGSTNLTTETPPPPVQGVSANLLPFQGTVLVNGTPLLVGEQIPFGATIDTTHGTVVLITMYNGVLQSFQFAGGIFVLTQGPDGTTVLTLTGGNFAGICGSTKTTKKNGIRELSGLTQPKPPAPPPPHAKPTTVRSLWGNGHGRFEVKGKYAAATVRGTNFHVADRCDGTLVHVRTGIVAVLDLSTGKTILLTVGKSYLAK
jgi:hypothetical protein